MNLGNVKQMLEERLLSEVRRKNLQHKLRKKIALTVTTKRWGLDLEEYLEEKTTLLMQGETFLHPLHEWNL